MKLFYRTYGAGHPLLILHGLLGASGNWHSLAKRVFSKKYRVIAVDLRNHGKSPHFEEFSYDAMAGDLTELMDHLEIDSAHFLGHSMGGKTAMHFALLHSERIDGLVIADIAPVDYPHLHEDTLAALQSIDLSHYSSRNQIESVMSEAFEDRSVLQFLMQGVERKKGEYRWKFHLEAITNGYDSLQEAVLGWQPFEGSALFVRGGKSDYVLDSHMISIRTMFPYAEVETIQEAGHWIHADAPDQFGKIVMTFLETA
ncbi:MAG: alpha/beta fold hydrolase [Rhodothermales bacterium]|nr:alpha/beta fold hydrolase [Rhodothermales bacterium]